MKRILIVSMFALIGCNNDASSPLKDIKPIEIAKVITLSDDFSEQDSAWSPKVGKWSFVNGVLKQSATSHTFDVILYQKQKFSDVDVSVDFKPISGRIDASGGIIFRAEDRDNYFIVRANALENNFRLYAFKDGYRHQIATARVKTPSIAKIHTIRVVAKGDHIQAYLNGKLYIDHIDNSFSSGYVGLWTKADSITEFDNLKISASE
ncbi:MAG: DUF1080 domain-containing protein [Sulfurovum sp.]|nr:DUF1080 domain-containing protein [Sulfurovum sp.]